MSDAEYIAGLIAANARADAAIELALQAEQRLKIREEVLTLQIAVQESLKKSIEDSRERALREVERLKAELAERDKKAVAMDNGWRVGKTVPLNVYEGDQPVCQCHNAEDARRIVEAMNNAALNADEYGECPNCANPPHAGECKRKVAAKCQKCGGSGKTKLAEDECGIIWTNCPACHGTGKGGE